MNVRERWSSCSVGVLLYELLSVFPALFELLLPAGAQRCTQDVGAMSAQDMAKMSAAAGWLSRSVG